MNIFRTLARPAAAVGATSLLPAPTADQVRRYCAEHFPAT